MADQPAKPDVQTQAVLDMMNAGGPAMPDMPVAEARAALEEMTNAMDIEKTEVYKNIHREIAGPSGDIPVEIFWPRATEQSETLPIVLLFHGGGWILGSLTTHENMARFYCMHADAIVINVDYRLAPENRFPAGVEDCYAALCWAAENALDIGGDANRIAVTGDSAGGNLSAVVTQLAKLRGGPAIACQALVYPVVDLAGDATYPSREKFGGGDYFLSARDFEWIESLYLPDGSNTKDVRVSPIHGSDLSGLPPALVVTAGFDVLCDEGRDYAARLEAGGVPVEQKCFESTIHGFLSFGGTLDVGKEGLALVADYLHRQLAMTPSARLQVEESL